ncbi:MAG TPA: 3-hydroxyacyl-ACP dehydratase FabZ [Firmicutes bacterium]|nr:3-hydroxyacyl-ACP dehydratase FabZ [Candidatus Fermentithermobacillaceae bacterium]
MEESCLPDGSGPQNANQVLCGGPEFITGILPHREPFLFISRTISVVPGKEATAEYDVPKDFDIFRGHFPGHPIMPGVLILEFMAQAGALALLSLPQYKGKIAYLAGIDRARFKRPVWPGTTLRARVKIGAVRRGIGRGSATAFIGDDEIASATMVFAVVVEDNGV